MNVRKLAMLAPVLLCLASVPAQAQGNASRRPEAQLCAQARAARSIEVLVVPYSRSSTNITRENIARFARSWRFEPGMPQWNPLLGEICSLHSVRPGHATPSTRFGVKIWPGRGPALTLYTQYWYHGDLLTASEGYVGERRVAFDFDAISRIVRMTGYDPAPEIRRAKRHRPRR